MYELGRVPIFFIKPSLAQRATSKIFISFYIFNFGVVFYAHLIYIYFELKKTH
jgi:hypothetical protein